MATKEVTFLNYNVDELNNVYFYEDTVTATVLTGSETSLSAGWYVVDANLVNAQQLTLTEGVNLILADGSSYNATRGTAVTGNVTIYGGLEGTGAYTSTGVTELGKAATAAGIQVHTGSLTIAGGNILAYGKDQAAGIGSNKDNASQSITIVGGNVTAYGGEKAAGIGSGDDANAGTITIYSGVVNATGGKYGAGIGGGDGHSQDAGMGTFSEINIYGGQVYAHGGAKAAGIGSGASSGKSGDITIEGGNVTTEASKTYDNQTGAGIGGGGDSAVGTVTINGGLVNATTAVESSIGAGTDKKHSSSCDGVYVDGDMTLTKNGTTTVDHETGENITSKLKGSQSATATMGNMVISTEVTITEPGMYTQPGRVANNDGGYYRITTSGSLTIENKDVSFENNVVNNSLARGGAIYNAGTLYLDGQTANLEFADNKAIGNSDGAQGGAIYNIGDAYIYNATFSNNYATCCKSQSLGGAIYNAKDVTLTLSGVTFTGNKATTAGGAVYNAGALDLDGAVTLSTSTDTLYNAGTMTWYLDAGASVEGYQLVTNAEGSKQIITISSDFEKLLLDGKSYTIATGDFSDITKFSNFILTGIEGRNDVELTVNNGAFKYGTDGIMYALVTGTSDGKDTLTLKAVNTNQILVTTGEKWFKESTDTTSPSYPAEAITISGIVTGDNMNRIIVSGYGESATVEVGEDKKWSVTLPYDGTEAAREGETDGTTLTITGCNADAPTEVIATKEYTLKVDTVDPTLTYDITKAAYYDEAEKINWYKQGSEVTYQAKATDETSGVRIVKVNGEEYAIDEQGYGEILTLNTDAETSTEMWLVFTAQDNAGNACTTVGTENEFNYQIDGSGPVIGKTVFYAGDKEAYVDDKEGIAWFKQGDSAVLKSAIVDELSGLKEAEFFTSQYVNGGFVLSTEKETKVTDRIEATDNVGNVSESDDEYTYGVDGTGPVIGEGTFEGKTLYVDGNGKSWFKKGDTTAALVIDITDELSGLKEATFAGAEYDAEDGKFMLAEADPTQELKIVATDNVGNVSEKSKTKEEVAYKFGIDATGPTISVTTVPATDLTTGTVTVTVKAADTESGVYSVGYSFDDNEWIWQTGDTATFTVDQNQLIYVAAYDNVINKTKDTYQVANICKNGDDFVATEGKTLTVAAGDEYRLNSLTLEDGSSFTLGTGSQVFAKTIEMQNGTLDATEGIMLNETLKVVSGTDNKLVGVIKDFNSVSNVVINDGAVLNTDKAQFDGLMQFTDFASIGKLYVSAVEGNLLTESDITALVGKTAVGTVEFAQDLVNIHKLTIKDDKVGMIGFQNGYGTEKNDTLRFSRNSSTVFGNTGYVIDLDAGNNKIQVDKNADLVLKAGVSNVSSFKIDKNAAVELNAAINFANGRNASFKVGKDSSVVLDAEMNGGDRKLTVSADKNTTLTTGDITAQTAGDKISIGAGSKFYGGNIDLGAGSNKISTGKASGFSAGSISNVGNISLGAYSTMQIGNAISGTQKLTIGNGKSFDEGNFARLTAGAVTGTAANDSYNFGNYNEVDLTSVDFGLGNDTLKVGSAADLEIDKLDFGEGKDKLTIGKDSKLRIAELAVDSLETLSMGKGAGLWLGTDSYKAALDTAWGQKYKDQIHDLGTLA